MKNKRRKLHLKLVVNNVANVRPPVIGIARKAHTPLSRNTTSREYTRAIWKEPLDLCHWD